MRSSALQAEARAKRVRCTDDELIGSLVAGRRLSVPLAWFPRLASATPALRSRCELLGNGQGIHWSGLDEDISVAGLLAGKSAI